MPVCNTSHLNDHISAISDEAQKLKAQASRIKVDSAKPTLVTDVSLRKARDMEDSHQDRVSDQKDALLDQVEHLKNLVFHLEVYILIQDRPRKPLMWNFSIDVLAATRRYGPSSEAEMGECFSKCRFSCSWKG